MFLEWEQLFLFLGLQLKGWDYQGFLDYGIFLQVVCITLEIRIKDRIQEILNKLIKRKCFYFVFLIGLGRWNYFEVQMIGRKSRGQGEEFVFQVKREEMVWSSLDSGLVDFGFYGKQGLGYMLIQIDCWGWFRRLCLGGC